MSEGGLPGALVAWDRQHGLVSSDVVADTPDRLTKQRRALPDAPGVYLFHNTAGKVIYVGKAKSIRKRVAWHFSNSVTRGGARDGRR